MQRYLLARLGLVVFVLVGVTLLVFLVTRLTPGDPARVLLGPRATEQEVQRLRVAYGLDQPIHVQYATWLGHVVRGDLGDSIQLHRPVLVEVAEHISGSGHCRLRDLIPDAVGIMLGSGTVFLWNRMRKTLQPSQPA